MANPAAARLSREWRDIVKEQKTRAAARAKAKEHTNTTASSSSQPQSSSSSATSASSASSSSSTSSSHSKSSSSSSPSSSSGVSKYDDDSEIILFPPDESKLFNWTAYILGPPDCPFEGARFELRFQIPTNYPHNPPKVRFVTRVFHPNVHWQTGEICLDILKDEGWRPIWGLEGTCRAIIFLLGKPYADSPLNCDAGNLVRYGDMRGYYSMARSLAIEHAQWPVKYRPPKLSVVSFLSAPAPAGPDVPPLMRTPSDMSGAVSTSMAGQKFSYLSTDLTATKPSAAATTASAPAAAATTASAINHKSPAERGPSSSASSAASASSAPASSAPS